MKHLSVKMNTPCEFINITEINPLISHVNIKVCYVGEQPNRNDTIITKETALKMAQTLPGAPIVGFYNDAKQDFESHNKVIEITADEIKFKETTRPYGFVDLNAKVWFQKYFDDNKVEREYLCTEGYIWTGQYEEAQRIIDKGNNQSMHLDEKTVKGEWTNDYNFFIINEAIISNLCILGEDVEPCFEGANIANYNLHFDDEFKNTLYSMMKEIKEYIEGGKEQMFTEFAVSIGDELWQQLYDHLVTNYPESEEDHFCSKYNIEGIYEESGAKFAVVRDRKVGSYYRLNIAINEQQTGFNFDNNLIEVTKEFTPAATPQFALEDVEAYAAEYKKAKEEEEKKGADEEKKPAEEDKNANEGKEESAEEEKKEDEPAEEDKKKKKEYSLDEIPEYVALSEELESVKVSYAEAQATIESLNAELETLREFKAKQDRLQKEEMINSFTMLTADQKKDVVEHIDEYSLDDIEAKLSIICVRNKVNFSLDDDKESSQETTYNLNGGDLEDATPDWIKAIQRAAENN